MRPMSSTNTINVYGFNLTKILTFLVVYQLCTAELRIPRFDYYEPEHPIHVAVELKYDDISFARRFAEKHGLQLVRKIGDIPGHFLFENRESNKRKHDAPVQRKVSKRFHNDEHVIWHLWQFPKKRVKRQPPPEGDRFNWQDPWYHLQWFIHDDPPLHHDSMGIRAAWGLGYTGTGSVVSILDDGVEWKHPDLEDNYDPEASSDINGNDADPTPQRDGFNSHGTRCAGQVASVAGNRWCGVGIAYNASIGGIRILDGPISDSVEAAALSLNQQHIDIYSSSWGPDDDGITVDGPGRLVKTAFAQGIATGRRGKGNIFVWASGNGGVKGDVCSCDGYSTAIETLSVGAVSFNHELPWYSEQCSGIVAVTYSSHTTHKAVVTTDVPSKCTDQHTGTSASAPNAAGIVALMLQANQNLTWRDVQHLTIRTSDPSKLFNNTGWSRNSVGRYVSNKFGYGIMNAEKLVLAAKKWVMVPEQKECRVDIDAMLHSREATGKLSGDRRYEFTQLIGDCECADVNYLEHVHVIVNIKYSRRGDLQMSLVSPNNTKSIVLGQRRLDVGPGGFYGWKFLTVHHWGEYVRGNWTLVIENMGSPSNFGTLYGWSLIFYGTSTPAQPTDPIRHSTSRRPVDDCPIRTKEATEANSVPMIIIYVIALIVLAVLIFVLFYCLCYSKKKGNVGDSSGVPGTNVSAAFSNNHPSQVAFAGLSESPSTASNLPAVSMLTRN